jgi:tetratricopeptide (TPR) repeat protein
VLEKMKKKFGFFGLALIGIVIANIGFVVNSNAENVNDPTGCLGKLESWPQQDIKKACELFVASGKGSKRDRAEAFTNLGYISGWSGSIQEAFRPWAGPALGYWQQALAEDPNYLEAYLAIAEVNTLQGKHLLALETINKAKTIAKDDWRVHLAEALVYFYAQDFQGAAPLIQKAMELANGEPRPKYIWALVLMRLERFEEALPLLVSLTETYEPSTWYSRGPMAFDHPLKVLAQAYDMKGDTIKSIVAMKAFVDEAQAGNSMPEDYVTFARLNASIGQYEEAISMIEKAIPELPLEIAKPYHVDKILWLFKSGSADKALLAARFVDPNVKLRAILRLQVGLRNAGYDTVKINGEFDPATEDALNLCIASKECKPMLIQRS